MQIVLRVLATPGGDVVRNPRAKRRQLEMTVVSRVIHTRPARHRRSIGL